MLCAARPTGDEACESPQVLARCQRTWARGYRRNSAQRGIICGSDGCFVLAIKSLGAGEGASLRISQRTTGTFGGIRCTASSLRGPSAFRITAIWGELANPNNNRKHDEYARRNNPTD